MYSRASCTSDQVCTGRCVFQTPDSGSAVHFTESSCSTHLFVVGLFAQVVDAVVVVLQQQVWHVLLVAELVVAQQAH